jgi:hypothetical protein
MGVSTTCAQSTHQVKTNLVIIVSPSDSADNIDPDEFEAPSTCDTFADPVPSATYHTTKIATGAQSIEHIELSSMMGTPTPNAIVFTDPVDFKHIGALAPANIFNANWGSPISRFTSWAQSICPDLTNLMMLDSASNSAVPTDSLILYDSRCGDAAKNEEGAMAPTFIDIDLLRVMWVTYKNHKSHAYYYHYTSKARQFQRSIIESILLTILLII